MPEEPKNDAKKTPKYRGKDRKHRVKHDYKALVTLAKSRDITRIDARTELGRELNARRNTIYADLGGLETLSQIKVDLIDRYLRSLILIDSIDSYLFTIESVVRKRDRKLYDIVMQRQKLMDGLTRMATALGLERAPAASPSIAAILNRKSSQPVKETAFLSTPPTFGRSVATTSIHRSQNFSENFQDNLTKPLEIRTYSVPPVQHNDQWVSRKDQRVSAGIEQMSEATVWRCRNCQSDSIVFGHARPVGVKCGACSTANWFSRGRRATEADSALPILEVS